MTKITIFNAATGELITKDMTAKEQAEFDARQVSVSTPLKEKDYISQRRNAYPSIGDQLDMLWHSIDQNPKLKSEYFEFYEAIKAVKVKHPKNG